MKIAVLIQSLGKSASENRTSQASDVAVYAAMWRDDDKNSSSEIKPGVDGPLLLWLLLLVVGGVIIVVVVVVVVVVAPVR